MSSNQITIALPSLIHRIGKEGRVHLQQIASETHCSLKRVRRSRNWQLIGEREDLESLHARLLQVADGSLEFVSKKVTLGLRAESVMEKSEPITLEQQLLALIAENDAITLSELMEATNCSMREARAARFQADEF